MLFSAVRSRFSVSFLSNQLGYTRAAKEEKFAYIFRNYDVFTVHKINTISPYLEIVCQQIFFLDGISNDYQIEIVPRFVVGASFLSLSHPYSGRTQSRQSSCSLLIEFIHVSERVYVCVEYCPSTPFFGIGGGRRRRKSRNEHKIFKRFCSSIICFMRMCNSVCVQLSGSVCEFTRMIFGVELYILLDLTCYSCWLLHAHLTIFLSLLSCVVFKRTAKIHHFHTLDWH